MASLFLVGNTNRYTFTNSALAAHVRDKDLQGKGLTDVFVLHSPESEKQLAETDDWKGHLGAHGLHPELFVNCTVDLRGPGDQKLGWVAHHVERFLKSLDRREDVYVDLMNGNSLYKSVLANIAYVLGVRRQFVINTSMRNDFLGPATLRTAYVELPDPALLDSVAPAWLTEVRRFNVNARDAARTLRAISGTSAASSAGFEADIKNAIQAWFGGVKHNDGAALGGAVRHIGRAFEDMIRGLHDVMTVGNKRPKTLNDMLANIGAQLNRTTIDSEPQLFGDIANLLRRLRNVCTHEQISPEIGRIHARLSTELLLATAEYIRIYHERGAISPPIAQGHIGDKCAIEGKAGELYFFGLDGDDTGAKLERLFQGSTDIEVFSEFSARIDNAIRAVAERIVLDPIKGEILFCSGDDMLFRGRYHQETLEALRSIYSQVSGDCTCSIGFGRTPKEAYIAMKMAKASPGKDSTMGIELLPSAPASIE